MDVYCHPFTSGGQEIPIQEAKLTELITLVTNYSCGEDCSTEESGGFPLEWAEYREPGTQFIKASTLPISISNQLQHVYNLSTQDKINLGRKARQFVVNNYDIKVVGKFFEDLFDSLPPVTYVLQTKKETCDAFYEPNNNLPDKEWIESLYDNILRKSDPLGVVHWIQRLKTDLKRNDVIAYFRKVALSQNQTNYLNDMLDSLKENIDNKKIAYVQPENPDEIIISTAMISAIKKLYPNYDIYYFTKAEYFDLVNSHPDIKKVLNYFSKMDDPLFFEGKAADKKYFDMVFAPYLSIRNNYFRNAEDKIQYDIYESN